MRKDVNAVAFLRPKPDQVQTNEPSTFIQISWTKNSRSQATYQVNGYLVNQGFEEANQLWKSGYQGEAS